MVFHSSLCDSKSPQAYKTLLSILADLNDAVVWTVYGLLPISKSSSSFTNPFRIVTGDPIAVGTANTFMFYRIFSSLARSKYLYLFLLSLIFSLWSAETAKFSKLNFYVNYLIILSSGRDSVIYFNLNIPQNLCVSFSRTYFGLCIKFHFFAQFPVGHFSHPVVSCIILPLRQFAAFADLLCDSWFHLYCYSV